MKNFKSMAIKNEVPSNSNKEAGYLSQMQETELVINRRKDGSIHKLIASQEYKQEHNYAEITSPERRAILLPQSALVQVAGSPSSKRYSSMRKIDFNISSSKKSYNSVKKLNFIK